MIIFAIHMVANRHVEQTQDHPAMMSPCAVTGIERIKCRNTVVQRQMQVNAMAGI